ncbi:MULTISPECIES: TetR/AcrR family transcriptional regulator [unclassified Paenibacillus]|uniref:TetR/AcrR family transcriptional regulator n=1 Tax=unclassified Paenibacillus TaxID=185978 RepID=UPI00089478CC|nr:MULTISPECIES: TetR/AcrR family transcriptional regulator [unclassified Paenibacillus]OMC63505.1 hypothetical protein BK126_27250 [Paenibacillus sp. FSL H7-0326]SDX81036.1 transcriptional regulator, TetR family [Paenibacillus sp. PDC88]
MAGNRQEIRSEETKRVILAMAAELFSKRGFDMVSMREIARAAGCSHTTIYIYFKDKQALLHELSVPPLERLKSNMLLALDDTSMSSKERLIEVSWRFIEFCLHHRNMHTIFFGTNTERVDIEPELPLNKLRNELFNLFKRALGDIYQLEELSEVLLSFSRIYFYMLHGIVGTYHQSSETAEELSARLLPTFKESFEIVLLGFTEKLKSRR